MPAKLHVPRQFLRMKFCAAITLLACMGVAQAETPAFDRPGIAFSVTTLPAGSLSWEQGLPDLSRDRSDGITESYSLTLGGNFADDRGNMVISLGLAMEAAGPGANVAQINAKLRDVANPPGNAIYTFAEGKAQLAKKAKVNYEGASGKLDFDKFGDVTPDFGVYIIEKGQLVRRDVVSLT